MREAVVEHGFSKQRQPFEEANVSKAIVVLPEHRVKQITGRKGNQDLATAMYNAYVDGASLAEIAAAYGRTRQAVFSAFKRRGWPMRPHLRYGQDNHFYRGGARNQKSANHKVEKAIQRGSLVPESCEQCGEDSGVYAHHDDYNKPLAVRWLCVRCHFEWHEKNTAIE